MFGRRTRREDDREIADERASDGRERYVRDDAPRGEYAEDRGASRASREYADDRDAPRRSREYADDRDVVRPSREYADDRDVAPSRREYVDDDLVRPSNQEFVEERGDTYLASLPARVNMVLFALLVALESLLGLRFALIAFGANTSSSFVRFIRNVSHELRTPLAGIKAVAETLRDGALEDREAAAAFRMTLMWEVQGFWAA